MKTDLQLLARLVVGFLLAVGLFLLAFSMEADAGTHTPNQPEYWGEDCSKIDEYQGGNSWESDQTYRLVILEAGTQLTTYEEVQQGQVLTSGNEKDISHIIVCPPEPPTTTTVPESTTTTQPPESTTTTDSPGTTSTTVPESTTTTDSAPPSTPSTSPPPELPYTGTNDYLWVLGLVSLAAGAGLIAFGRGKS